MELIIDVVMDALVDSLKILPFLFITYLLMEYLEHKTQEYTSAIVQKTEYFGPLWGGLIGVFPQCGFSAAASNLYAGRVITLGTLIAIYLSTSDEMIPLFISEQVPAGIMIKILVIKAVIGIIAGYCGGKVDTFLMRITDMMMAFPGIVLAIAIAGVLGGSVVNTVLALAVVGWTKYARLGRSLTLKLVQSEFIQAAVTNGTKPVALLHRHIVPNIMQMVIVTGAMDIGSMIMEIAGLSFLGFGAQPPTAEWGLMLNEGRQVMQMAPWAMIFPGLAILFVVSSFNLWGDSLRDLMDPSRSH